MAADDLMKIRITADFKEAEGAFLKMAKVATAAANKKTAGKDEGDNVKLKCVRCDKVFDSKVPKFQQFCVMAGSYLSAY